MQDWYPEAVRTPLTRNFDVGRAGNAAPQIIVDHITDGETDPYGWWNRVCPPNEAASADFCVFPDGTVKQYVRLSDTSWSNGPLVNPDMGNPFILWIVDRKKVHPDETGNTWTVSIEHVGRPGKPLTAAQIASSNKLHRWLSATFGIPLDRDHVLGHYQFDSVTRPNCPGSAFPWSYILKQETTMVPDDIKKLMDKYYALAPQTKMDASALRATNDPALIWWADLVESLGKAMQDGAILAKKAKGWDPA